MNVDSILISEFATLTPGNQLTVVRTFNSLAATNFPAQRAFLAISLVIHAHRSERGTEHEVEIRVVGPSETKPLNTGKFTLPSGDPPAGMPLRYTYVHQTVGIGFATPGSYAFEVYIDGTYSAASTVHIRQKTE
ncbi:MAG TPA: hypothetical protein VM198_05005 [Longimicrobiales bacterium]|nr:hypothetical protein [Longimicrobiales bacterium]